MADLERHDEARAALERTRAHEQEAIRLHERAAERMDHIADDLDRAAETDRDDRLRRKAHAIAAQARGRAAAARRRAAMARVRLDSAGGDTPAMDESVPVREESGSESGPT